MGCFHLFSENLCLHHFLKCCEFISCFKSKTTLHSSVKWWERVCVRRCETSIGGSEVLRSDGSSRGDHKLLLGVEYLRGYEYLQAQKLHSLSGQPCASDWPPSQYKYLIKEINKLIKCYKYWNTYAVSVTVWFYISKHCRYMFSMYYLLNIYIYRVGKKNIYMYSPIHSLLHPL